MELFKILIVIAVAAIFWRAVKSPDVVDEVLTIVAPLVALLIFATPAWLIWEGYPFNDTVTNYCFAKVENKEAIKKKLRDDDFIVEFSVQPITSKVTQLFRGGKYDGVLSELKGCTVLDKDNWSCYGFTTSSMIDGVYTPLYDQQQYISNKFKGAEYKCTKWKAKAFFRIP